MRIKLENKSSYRDDDIRQIVRAACKAAGVRCDELRLKVTNQRSNARYEGKANCAPGCRDWSSAYMWLYLRRPADLKATVLVALHEAMHLAGARHADMTEEQRSCTGPMPAWAEGLQLRIKESPSREEQSAALRASRLSHAEAMLKKAHTRAKRAETIRKKWERRVRALNRASSRSSGGQDPTPSAEHRSAETVKA